MLCFTLYASAKRRSLSLCILSTCSGKSANCTGPGLNTNKWHSVLKYGDTCSTLYSSFLERAKQEQIVVGALCYIHLLWFISWLGYQNLIATYDIHAHIWFLYLINYVLSQWKIHWLKLDKLFCHLYVKKHRVITPQNHIELDLMMDHVCINNLRSEIKRDLSAIELRRR